MTDTLRTVGNTSTQSLKDILSRMAWKEPTPEERVRAEAERVELARLEHAESRKAVARKLADGLFPADKRKMQIDAGNPIIEKLRTEYLPAIWSTKGTLPWVFFLAPPGAGKTTALVWTSRVMLEHAMGGAFGYFVFSELVGAMLYRKMSTWDLVKYRVLAIDDFYKGVESERLSDIVKTIVDTAYRNNIVLLLAADIDLATIRKRIHAEYQEQIIGRIWERTKGKGGGRFIYGFECPNMRRD